MKKIKVLRIIARLNIGGPARHVILLTEGLDKDRFESILVVGRKGKVEGDMSYLAREKGVSAIIIPELGRNLNIRNDIIALWKLFCLMKKEEPDIIHTHTAKAGTLGRIAAILYNLICRKRSILIHTFHGHVLHSYFGRIKNALFIGIERFLAIFTDRIIAVSKNLRKELLGFKISSAEKIITIPLGLELDECLRIENNGSVLGENKSIGIIGRLVVVKNHKMFLEAAKRLKNLPALGRKIKFLIVGDGPLRGELENYADELGIAKDVTFAGWIKDLRKVYSEMDIVTLTSLNEGTPVALIEAQAAGRPCVATNVGGVADVIEEGKGGFLVPSYNIDKFTEALSKLLNNPDLALSMGRYGREKVMSLFNKTRLFRDMEDMYGGVLSSKRN
ncbi:MAG: glycosyltransferase family 4 protein [Candidatus Omnitrophota bacterium]|nr:MAG: glycosyltransferase family 4 protein [Candidatus Omnitrophota bacterium]